jgi:hypothetical protein
MKKWIHAEPPRQLLVVEKFAELRTPLLGDETQGPSTALAALRSGRDDSDVFEADR